MRHCSSKFSTTLLKTMIDANTRRLRMTISMAGAEPSLEDATCRRTLWSDGTLFEMVEFHTHNAGPDELTDEELDTWVESFPVD